MFSFYRRRFTHEPEQQLIAVFEETKHLLARAENDYSGTGWYGPDVALRDIESVITPLRCGKQPDCLRMELLFAPSGPLQEVSLRSGWETAFFHLADRFDCAMYDYRTSGTQQRESSRGWLIPA